MKKGAAIFAILMGVAMTATWVTLFSLGQYPAAITLPLETGYLLTAEALTAIALIVGGYSVLAHHPWGMPILLIALGELIYCAIRFAGELGQEGSQAGLGFFTSVAIFALFFATNLVKSIIPKRV